LSNSWGREKDMEALNSAVAWFWVPIYVAYFLSMQFAL
jgi:hypothetical protein